MLGNFGLTEQEIAEYSYYGRGMIWDSISTAEVNDFTVVPPKS